MAPCPAGHDSATDDYCDSCGTSMSGGAPPPVSTPPATAKVCPNCSAIRDGRFCEECGFDSTKAVVASGETVVAGRGEWSVLVTADRSWFDEVRRREGPDVATIEFPQYCPARRFVLSGSELAIGRRSRSRGTDPEIDLTGPPLDPGVSAQHAALLRRPDGGWELVDLGSTNGTVISKVAGISKVAEISKVAGISNGAESNGAEISNGAGIAQDAGPGTDPDPIPPHRPVALSAGDRILIGAWTTLTVTFTAE